MQNLIRQLVVLQISRAVILELVDRVKATDTERQWLFVNSVGVLDGMRLGTLGAARDVGITIPDEVAAKDVLPYEGALEIVRCCLNTTGKISESTGALAQSMCDASIEAFGHPEIFRRQMELNNQLTLEATRANPRDICDVLYQRHLRLVN